MQRELVGSENTVLALRFTPDQQSLLSGGMDDQLRLWPLAEQSPSRVLGRHESSIRSIVLDRRGIIVTGSDDRHVAFWHPTRGLVDRRQTHESIVYETAMSPDGEYLVTVGQDRAVKVWLANRPQPILFAGHVDKVRAIALSSDSKMLITSGEDQRILFWRLPAGGTPTEIRTNDFIYDIAISPDGRWLTSAGREKAVRLWSTQSQEAGYVLGRAR